MDMVAYFCLAGFCECAFIVFKLWTSTTVRALVTHVVAPVADLGQDYVLTTYTCKVFFYGLLPELFRQKQEGPRTSACRALLM